MTFDADPSGPRCAYNHIFVSIDFAARQLESFSCTWVMRAHDNHIWASTTRAHQAWAEFQLKANLDLLNVLFKGQSETLKRVYT